jgi:1,2-diacylglycerol-3-alpha-glucose alpha-1,2-galactosyltransferase
MKIRINMISESEISVRGHGVHTAYVELVRALNARSDCEVVVNEFFKKTHADITHIHTIGLHSWTKLLWGDGPKIVSAHVVPDSLVGSLALASQWKPLARLYMKLFYSKADLVLAVSGMVARSLIDELGVPSEKVTVLHNSINTKYYIHSVQDKKDARKKLAIDTDAFVVMGNGQVQPRKRFDTFISCAEKLPDVTFVWVGGIPFKHVGAGYQEMKKLMENIPKNMSVTGVIELSEVRQYLRAADVFVLPAEQENHPMAVIEAAAASLPIVLRDIPEYDDTFGDDIMRAKDDTEFSLHIQHLRENAALRAAYKKRSDAIAQRFDSKVSAAALVGIYKKLIAARRGNTE